MPHIMFTVSRLLDSITAKELLRSISKSQHRRRSMLPSLAWSSASMS